MLKVTNTRSGSNLLDSNCQSDTNVTVEVCNVVIKRISGLTVTMTCVGHLDMFL